MPEMLNAKRLLKGSPDFKLPLHQE